MSLIKKNTKLAHALSAHEFFSKPSKLSTGAKNRRFKGTAKTMSHLAACTEQSGNLGE